MEKLKSNLSQTTQTIQTLSQTPLKKIVFDETLYSQADFNASRMQFIKRFIFWFIIIILLSLYGFNIFTYLAQGTDIITALISPFTYVFALLTGNTFKSTIENTSQGGQTLISGITNFFTAVLLFFSQFFTGSLKVAENTSVSAIDQLQSNIIKDKVNSGEIKKNNKVKETEEITETEEESNSMLKSERKLNERTHDVTREMKNIIRQKEDTDPSPLQSSSIEQGYCYTGKQNNIRHCAKVSSRNKCMSGDIFPTMDLCINPTLRS